MKANRDNVVGRLRNIKVDGRELVEQEVREMVKVLFYFHESRDSTVKLFYSG